MSRLIDADALMKAMYHRAFETDGATMWQSGCWMRYRAIEQTVKEQPTIEPKKGRWIQTRHFGLMYRMCSSCSAERKDDLSTGWNYCPYCGADMRPREE